MALQSYILNDERATERFGERLASVLTKGDVVCLAGSLGAGKSTLARALIRKIAGKNLDVPSPTFTLVETYTPINSDAAPIWHFDMYRLDKTIDVEELGLGEAMQQGVCIIEWAERVASLLPTDCLIIALRLADSHKTGNDEQRILTISGNEAWQERLEPVNFSG